MADDRKRPSPAADQMMQMSDAGKSEPGGTEGSGFGPMPPVEGQVEARMGDEGGKALRGRDE